MYNSRSTALYSKYLYKQRKCELLFLAYFFAELFSYKNMQGLLRYLLDSFLTTWNKTRTDKSRKIFTKHIRIVEKSPNVSDFATFDSPAQIVPA